MSPEKKPRGPAPAGPEDGGGRQLAGGVAHDFNKSSRPSWANAQLLQMKTAEDDPLRLYIEQILQSVERATHVTHTSSPSAENR